MRYLAAILSLLLCWSVLGAAGDIESATVLDNGWQLQIVMEGTETNGTFANGLGANNSIDGSSGIVLTVTSPGYNDDGTTNQTTRTLYGTKLVRFAYPNQIFTDTTTDGSSVTIKVALSDFVYAGDIDLTVDLAAGMYATNALSSAAASAFSVANSSTQPWTTVIGNWTWPGWNLVSGTMRLRAVAFHGSAQDRRPVRAVEFRATVGATTITNIQTEMQIDRTLPDAVPFGEYVADIDISGFNQGDAIICNFTAYPWHGTNVLNTEATSFVLPTGLPAPQTNYCNNAGTYGITRAIVDSASGNDGTGLAANEESWAADSSPAAFATIGAALTKIVATNNASYGRAEPGGGIVYLAEGNHSWLGSSWSYSVVPQTWVEVRQLTSGAKITAFGTDSRGLSNWDKIKLIDIEHDTSTSPYQQQHVWMDGCRINATGTTIFQTSTTKNLWYLTHCAITNIAQGIKAFTGQQLIPAIVRGNNFHGFSKTAHIYTMVGNTHPASAEGSDMVALFDASSQAWEIAAYPILYANTIYGVDSLGDILRAPEYYNSTNGFAIVQNLFEQTTNNTGSTGFSLVVSTVHATNALIWNNTLLGTKTFVAYNADGADPYYRWLWSAHNNLFDDYNLKSDSFAPESANRIGSWPVMFGVGCSGNIDLSTANIGAPTSFAPDGGGNFGFGGLRWVSYYVENGGASSTNYPAFVDRQAHDGANIMPGGGNYRLQSQSPLSFTPGNHRVVLPFDLEGNARCAFDPPGAYSSASPRKGAGFF